MVPTARCGSRSNSFKNRICINLFSCYQSVFTFARMCYAFTVCTVTQSHFRHSCNLLVGVIFVSVQPSSTTLFGVPFPLPTPQGRRDSHLRTTPEREFRMLRKATPRTWRPLWQTSYGRSARVAARPEGQAAPPHVFNLPERLSPPSHGFS